MKNTTTIIFSKNRSMQLDCLLRTLLLNCPDILEESDVNVLYDIDREDHKKSYDILKKEYKNINFIQEYDFKQDLLNLLKDKENVLFLVDDTIFTKQFSLKRVLTLLNTNELALGFSLRLGKNTVKCYPVNKDQEVPHLVDSCNKEYAKFCWTTSEFDFGYPLELSSSVYRVKDILNLLENCDYHNPNSLESVMALNVQYFSNEKPILMCFCKSVAFSDPLNKVQNFNNNRSENISMEYLLLEFEYGYRIDIDPFNGFVSNGAHQYVPVDLVKMKEEYE